MLRIPDIQYILHILNIDIFSLEALSSSKCELNYALCAWEKDKIKKSRRIKKIFFGYRIFKEIIRFPNYYYNEAKQIITSYSMRSLNSPLVVPFIFKLLQISIYILYWSNQWPAGFLGCIYLSTPFASSF